MIVNDLDENSIDYRFYLLRKEFVNNPNIPSREGYYDSSTKYDILYEYIKMYKWLFSDEELNMIKELSINKYDEANITIIFELVFKKYKNKDMILFRNIFIIFAILLILSYLIVTFITGSIIPHGMVSRAFIIIPPLIISIGLFIKNY